MSGDIRGAISLQLDHPTSTKVKRNKRLFWLWAFVEVRMQTADCPEQENRDSESCGLLSLRVPRCPYRLKEFVVNWFTRYGFGSHLNEWLALAMVILVSFALCIASLKLALWLPTRKRGTDKSEKDYWRIHGG